MVNSPLGRTVQPASSIPPYVRSPSQQPPHSSPLISPVPAGTVGTHLPRTSSVPSIDALADFASAKATPPVLTSRDSLDSQKSSSGLFPHLTSAGATSNPRASIDINMVDTPKQQVRADYSDTSLSVDKQQRLAVLAAYIQESPSSYEAHKEIITLLHTGFSDYTYPPDQPEERRDPRTYDLLPDLRQARENLDKLFAVGEEQWLDWLQDESILARTTDERVAVVEKFRRAVSEEFGSTKLWAAYGDWVVHCYKWALDGPTNAQTDAETDRLVGREVFDRSLVLDTWNEAIVSTRHDMSGNHEVWDQYMVVQFGDLAQKMGSADAARALELFESRLRIPHAEWQQTFQTFSSFVSANFPTEQYEEIMASTLRDSANAKKIWADRDTFETALSQAQALADPAAKYQALYQAFSSYIEWEREQEDKPQTQKRGKARRPQEGRNHPFDMLSALYSRVELRFPSVVTIWEDHIDYLIEKSEPVLEVLARATKHCPWSGTLWKQYLLASELADLSFDETEKIKHKATSTGLLDAAGIEEALLVYDAWCGYLLRRSKRPDASEEDADVAEMGIRSSIEAVQSNASKLGLGGAVDPLSRLRRKYVEYLKSQGRLDNAETQFNDAVGEYGSSYKFWLRYYEFETQKSVHMALIQRAGPDRMGSLSSAPFAVGVLKQALTQPELDYPEPIMEALLNHCEDYEDAEELQSAMILVRKVQKTIAAKREREAAQAGEVPTQNVQMDEALTNGGLEAANGLHTGKRKREEDVEESDAIKRQRNEEAAEQSAEKPAAEEELKRDREHASVLVQHIPTNVTETKIRQYFSACGVVKQLKLLQDEQNSVIVEFEDAAAAQFALSRDGREFEGAELSIMLNTGSTLFVTNYPATADDAYIRNLFREFGEILNVRFPSLQWNKKRRFCYVEFKRAQDAQRATEVDGEEHDGLPLVAKISNPAVRETRKEVSHEGRQLFVGQVPFKAKASDIEKLFSRYGTVEVKLPQDETAKKGSRNRGFAFVSFGNAEEAQAALEMNGADLMDRKITVKLSSDRDNRSARGANGRTKSPSVQPERASTTGDAQKHISQDELIERRERTVAISGVPDTVNDHRIRAVAEKIGAVRKVLLKIHHQGALIEFENAADAGRAMIELDNLEIDPGRHIQVTTEKEMMQQRAEVKTEQFSKRPPPSSLQAGNAPVKRPTQPGARRKGGHLGVRSAVLMGSSDKGTGEGGAVDGEMKKTNDDFRNMITKG
jgi:squamous cell carcinoma antigen recognized by T-cells 3